jgi:hypothetical protein
MRASILPIVVLVMWLPLTSHGQSAGEIKLTGIPHSLFWENNPVEVRTRPNEITIVAGSKTDMFRDPNATYNTDNAPKLLFRPDEDFVLTTTIEHAFTSKWDGGALILKQDSLHWIKFCYEKDYTGARRVVSVVTKNISDDCNSVSFNTNRIHFRVARAGAVITLYCSEDEKSWLLIRHLQFEFTKGLKVGFLAQSPTGERCEVTFSNIQYQAKKIKDPYAGE